MKLHNINLIEEFYEKEKNNYPNLSFEQFKEISAGPWNYLKEVMESGELEEVRLKYFGLFLVKRGRINFMLKNIKKRWKEGKIIDKQYKRLKSMIDNYLNKKDENT